MTGEVPLLQRVTNSYATLSAAAKDLNSISDELGKSVTDPLLKMVGGIAVVPIFLGSAALVFSQRMVDEDRLRAEPRVSKFVGGGIVPSRILTDSGRKVRKAAYTSLGIGGVMLLFIVWFFLGFNVKVKNWCWLLGYEIHCRMNLCQGQD